jgi:hypothetical protein
MLHEQALAVAPLDWLYQALLSLGLTAELTNSARKVSRLELCTLLCCVLLAPLFMPALLPALSFVSLFIHLRNEADGLCHTISTIMSCV